MFSYEEANDTIMNIGLERNSEYSTVFWTILLNVYEIFLKDIDLLFANSRYDKSLISSKMNLALS